MCVCARACFNGIQLEHALGGENNSSGAGPESSQKRTKQKEGHPTPERRDSQRTHDLFGRMMSLYVRTRTLSSAFLQWVSWKIKFHEHGTHQVCFLSATFSSPLVLCCAAQLGGE